MFKYSIKIEIDIKNESNNILFLFFFSYFCSFFLSDLSNFINILFKFTTYYQKSN